MQLTRSAKIFLVVVLLEASGVIGYGAVLIYYGLKNQADQMLYYAGCLITMAVTLAAMGFDCLRTENTVEMLCVLVMTLFFCGITGYIILDNVNDDGTGEKFVQTSVASDAGGYNKMAVIAFVASLQGSAMLTLVVTGSMTYKSFGWRIFKLFGTDKVMRGVFAQLLFAKAMLKLDLAASIAGLIQTAQLVMLDDVLRQVMVLGVAGLNILFLFLAWFSLTKEWGSTLCLAAPFALAQPGVLLYYALYELNRFERCGRTLLQACPEWNLTKSAISNCLDCGVWPEANETDIDGNSGRPGEPRCLVNCGEPNVEVGGLVVGEYTVLIYDPRYAEVWERPVYSTVALQVCVRMLLCYVLLVATRNFGKGLRNFRLNKLVPADVTELPKGFKLPEGTSPAHSARIAKCLHSMLKGGEVRLREVDPMTLSDAAANPKHHRSKNRRPSTSSAARKKTTAGKAGSKGRLGRLGRGRGRSHAPCPRRPRGAFPLFVSAS